MLQRFALVRLVTVLALGAMVSFLAMGCGDNTKAQVDAGQQDVAVPQEDAPVQEDAHYQVDAANTSGNVIIVNAKPQLSGNATLDAVLGGLQYSYVLAGWDPAENDPDVPLDVLDLRGGTPFGCYAKYYNKDKVADSGLPSNNLSTTANAGDITVEGYTKGQYIVGIQDSGAPVLADIFPNKVTCKRTELEEQDDAGVIPDAATGRFEYTCDNEIGGEPVPVTGFLTPGVDKLHVNASGGGYDIEAFDATQVDVAPFIKVLPTGSLWNLPANLAAAEDAGIPIGYACGSTDAGPDTAGCSAALAIQIIWGDVDTAITDIEASPPWRHEKGKIQCAKVGAGNKFFIPQAIWNTAFPSGANWRTITTFITHVTVVPEHGLSTVVGAGGGAVGITHHP